jgi:hypothetical protein
MTRRKTFALIALLFGTALAVTAIRAEAAGTDPFVGTFVMNVAKSTADPGPLPKSAKVTTADLGQGKLKTNTETVLQDGTTTRTEATYAYDGKDYPVTGNPNVETVAITRTDANTLEVTQKKGGKVVSTLTVKAAADGKTINTSFNGTNAEGKPVKGAGVYERQ